MKLYHFPSPNPQKVHFALLEYENYRGVYHPFIGQM